MLSHGCRGKYIPALPHIACSTALVRQPSRNISLADLHHARQVWHEDISSHFSGDNNAPYQTDTFNCQKELCI